MQRMVIVRKCDFKQLARMSRLLYYARVLNLSRLLYSDFSGEIRDFSGKLWIFFGENPRFSGEIRDFSGKIRDFSGEIRDF